MRKGILFTLVEKQAEDPDYWRNVNGNNIGFDGKPGSGTMVAGNPKAIGAGGSSSGDGGAAKKMAGTDYREKEFESGAELAKKVEPESDFANSSSKKLRIIDSDLSDSDFTGAAMWDTFAKKSNFSGSDFSGSSLVRGFSQDCDYKGADFTAARVRDHSFVGSDMEGVDFRHADVRGCNFYRVNLKGAKVHKHFIADNPSLDDEQIAGLEILPNPSPGERNAALRKYGKGKVNKDGLLHYDTVNGWAEESVDRGNRADGQYIVEWGKATHYKSVKNPKTGNMNKIGFNDTGLAVTGDADLMHTINLKRKTDVQGAKRAVNAPTQHNIDARRQDATGSSGTNRDYKYTATKRDNAAAERGRKNIDQKRFYNDDLENMKDDGYRNARKVERGAEKGFEMLRNRKAKLNALHGGDKKAGVLGALARKVKSFIKPDTLSDKDI